MPSVVRSGQQHSYIGGAAGQGLDSASPELRAKLEKRLGRIHGEKEKRAEKAEAEAEEEVSPSSANVATPRVAKFAPEADKVDVTGVGKDGGWVSAANAEANDSYDMLECSSMEVDSCSKDATKNPDIVRRKGDEHVRLEKESTQASKESACELGDDAPAASPEDRGCLDEAKTERGTEELKVARRSCCGQLISWVAMPLLAMCIGAGLAQQGTQQVLREHADQVFRQLLPQYQQACQGSWCDAAAQASHNADELEWRLRQSREFAQARKQTLQTLARTIVLGTAGAAILGPLLLLICPWSCVRWVLSALVALLAGLAGYAAATVAAGAPAAALAAVGGNA